MGTRRKLDIVVDAEYQGKREIQQAEQDITALGESSATSSFSFGDMAKGVATAGAAMAGAAVVAKELYDAIGEGAELISAEQKFLALNESIGGTEFALTELRNATKGMISDSELMAGAADLISLGIAKSQEEMVQWSKVVGGLNLDMQVLGLTLANNSKARLDSLGLSLEDVNKRTAEFVAAGKNADEAFDLAVLDGLNERMALLEDSLAGTAAQMATFEASWKNVTDSGKKGLSEFFAPLVNGLSENIDANRLFNEAMQKNLITIEEINEIIGENESVIGGQADAVEEVTRRVEEYNAIQQEAVDLQEESNRRTEAYQVSVRLANDALLDAAASQSTYIQAVEAGFEADERANAALEIRRQMLQEASIEYDTLGGFIGGLEGNATDTAAAFDSLAVSIASAQLADAVASGQLTAEQAAVSLVNIQEGLGLISGGEADQLRDAAERFGAVEEVIGTMSEAMVSGGGITVEESEKMADALDMIMSGATDTKDEMAVMAQQGGENVGTLGGSFSEFRDEVIAADVEVGLLKNMIIDGLPDEKVITIRINTVGSVPDLGGGGSTAATTTAVSNGVARD